MFEEIGVQRYFWHKLINVLCGFEAEEQGSLSQQPTTARSCCLMICDKRFDTIFGF